MFLSLTAPVEPTQRPAEHHTGNKPSPSHRDFHSLTLSNSFTAGSRVLVSSCPHVLMSSCPRVLVDLQGDGTRQRHGEPCRVPVPHHLLVNLKSFTYNSIGEDTDIFFSLYDLREAKTIRWERTDTLQVMMSVKAAVRDSDLYPESS